MWKSCDSFAYLKFISKRFRTTGCREILNENGPNFGTNRNYQKCLNTFFSTIFITKIGHFSAPYHFQVVWKINFSFRQQLLWSWECFLNNKRTDHAIRHHVSKTSSALDSSKYIVVVYLDWRKAIDIVKHEILLDKFHCCARKSAPPLLFLL